MVQRRDCTYIDRRMLKLKIKEEIHGCGARGYAVGVRKEDAEERKRWRTMENGIKNTIMS